MPNIKAAIKWVRQSEKRTLRNRDMKTRLKSIFKKARLSGAEEIVRRAESQYDKAASKGIIHPNKAARKKSRLAKHARLAIAAAAAAASMEPTVRAAAPAKRRTAKKR